MIKLLLGIRMRLMMSAMFGRKKKAVGIGLIVLGFVFYFIIVNGMVIPAIAIATDGLVQNGIEWVIVGIVLLAAFCLCFIGSVFMAYQQIYESKDNEMLMSMPIKPSQILFSRIFAIGVFNMIYALPFLTGTVAGYMIGKPDGSGFDAVFTGLVVIDYIGMVVFATMITCIFAWLLSLVLGKIQNKTLISTVMYIIFFVGYFYVIFNLQGFGDSIAKNGESIASGLNTFAKPVYFMAAGATEHNVLFTIAYMAIMLVPSVVIFWVMQKSYINILLRKKYTKRVDYKDEVASKRSVFVALLQKEISKFVGTPMYFLNYGASIIFPLLFIAYLFIKKNDYGSLVNLLSVYGVKNESALPSILAMALYSFTSTGSVMTAASINLEGKNLWILKSLPIPTNDILAAKAAVPFVCLLPFYEIFSVAAIILFPVKISTIFLLLLMPIATMAFFSQFGLYANLKHYKLDWISENEAFKRAGGPTIASLTSLGSLIALVLLYIFVLSEYIDFYGFMWIMFGGLVLGSFILYTLLRANGHSLFMKVE